MFGYNVSRAVETSEISTQTEDYRFGADFDMAKQVADVKPVEMDMPTALLGLGTIWVCVAVSGYLGF